MIAQDLLEYLNGTLTESVYMEAPESLTNYVLLDQTGTSRNNHIITTTIAIQSYASSLYGAMQLNETVKTAMDGFLSLSHVISVKLETDYNFTDTTTKQYRWQAVYAINHY